MDLKEASINYFSFITAATEPQELSQSHALYPASTVDYEIQKTVTSFMAYGTIAAVATTIYTGD